VVAHHPRVSGALRRDAACAGRGAWLAFRALGAARWTRPPLASIVLIATLLVFPIAHQASPFG
jgi:hypothetical protein